MLRNLLSVTLGFISFFTFHYVCFRLLWFTNFAFR